MRIGLNLSFAAKRWLDPVQLAKLIREDFGTDEVQFSWDMIDPWWPDEQRSEMIRAYKEAFAQAGIHIGSTFGGTASYYYAHLLAPAKAQRDAAFIFFKRAIDLTVEMGVPVMGTPVGGLTYSDARDPEKRKERYLDMLDYVRALAAYGKEKGLREIHIEPTPVFGEIPYGPEDSLQMMKDLEGSAIPVKLLIDWGHALYEPLLKEKADINLWFRTCAPFIGSIHLQQTDGRLDRHWDFTHEDGIVTPKLMRQATADAGLDDIVQYLEVVTAFEEDDDIVYDKMKRTMDMLHNVLDCK